MAHRSNFSNHRINHYPCGRDRLRGGEFYASEMIPKNNILNHPDEFRQDCGYMLTEGVALNTHVDSQELMYFVEGLVIVFSAKNTPGDNAKASIEFLKHHQNTFIGAC